MAYDDEGRAKDVGQVGFIEIFVDPDDGRITFNIGAKNGEQLPLPANGESYTEEELAELPVPYALAIIGASSLHELVTQMQAKRIAEFLKPTDGGVVH